jgi:crotonobetaine/carnitine-CoA ligase
MALYSAKPQLWPHHGGNVHGSPQRLSPFAGMDVWTLVQSRARLHPDRAFLTWQPFDGTARTWTYADLERDAAALAAGLSRRGVRAGDRVLIHLDNSPEFVLAWFACAALQAVAVTTNTRSAADEVAHYAADSEVVGAITSPRHVASVAAASAGLKWIVCTDHDAGVPAEVPAAAESLRSLVADPAELPSHEPDPTAPMGIQYTSGTTARAKGVLWTHANALWGAKVSAAHGNTRADDCHLVYLPLFHTNALSYSLLASLWAGSRLVLTPKWSTSRFWDLAIAHRCTWVALVGLSARAVIAHPPPGPHHLRHFAAGMCDLSIDAAYGVKTIGWYGMTETVTTPIAGDPVLPNRRRSIGRPTPEYGVRVVREDGRTPVEPEETGDLLIQGQRGLSVFREYLNQPEATATAFDADGWFITGDRVTVHADGHLTYAGRAKDMLKVGGENVAAVEIERVAAGLPGVIEAAAVGRPDTKLDEVPVLFVRTVDSTVRAADVLAACTSQLADFKVPREVHLVRELPRSTLNKVNKIALRSVALPHADRAAAERQWIEDSQTDPSGDASSDGVAP